MAFSIKKYNKGGKFGISTENLDYVKLKDLYSDYDDKIFVIGALYINTKSKFGENPVAVVMEIDETTGEERAAFCVNFPRHTLDDVQDIISSDEAVEAIKARKVGFSVREYYSKTYNTRAYGITWEDVD